MLPLISTTQRPTIEKEKVISTFLQRTTKRYIGLKYLASHHESQTHPQNYSFIGERKLRPCPVSLNNISEISNSNKGENRQIPASWVYIKITSNSSFLFLSLEPLIYIIGNFSFELQFPLDKLIVIVLALCQSNFSKSY